MKVENSIEEIAEVDEDRAIREIKRELADEDRKEYMSRWFAKDLEILIYYIEKLQKENEQLRTEVKRYKNMYEAEYQIHLVRNEQLDRKQKAIIKCNELENENKELKKENEKLKHKIEGQECVIETQAHNEEVYEKLVMKLEKENTELKEENEADYTTVYLKRCL